MADKLLHIIDFKYGQGVLVEAEEKPQGRPTLVPVTDKRPALKKTGAGEEFFEIKEDQSMSAQKSNTKVVTGIVRLSYANVWEPASINGSNPKYSVSLIIPKSDTKTIAAINAAVDAAIKEDVAKFGGKIPPKGALKLSLRDGEPFSGRTSAADDFATDLDDDFLS